jgi:hypothetical protein
MNNNGSPDYKYSQQKSPHVRQCKTVLKSHTVNNIRAIQNIRSLSESGAIRYVCEQYFKQNPIPFPHKPNK